MAHPLVESLLLLLNQQQNLEPAFEQWRKRCEQSLAQMPAAQRQEVIQQLQAVIAENHSLAMQETQHIWDELVQLHPAKPGSAAKAKRYNQIDQLKD